eukprot:jgi/Botrbrau1/21705/Bobra.43_1s0101.2
MDVPQRKRFARINAYFLVMTFWPLFVIAGWTDPGQTVDAHNQKRRIHGVPDLVWDDGLARGVESWVYQCDFQNSAGPHLENFYASPEEPVPSIYSVVGSWYKEINHYDFNRGGLIPGTGNFTQVIWRESQRVGCAFVTDCPRGPWKTILACDYAPRRNISNNSQDNILPLRDSFVQLGGKLAKRLARILLQSAPDRAVGQVSQDDTAIEVGGVQVSLSVDPRTVRYTGESPYDMVKNGVSYICKERSCVPTMEYCEGIDNPFKSCASPVAKPSLFITGRYNNLEQLESMVKLMEPVLIRLTTTTKATSCEEQPLADGLPRRRGKEQIYCQTYYEIPGSMTLDVRVHGNIQAELAYYFKEAPTGSGSCAAVKSGLEGLAAVVSVKLPATGAGMSLVKVGLDLLCT